MKILVLGYGNRSRNDDGAAWEVIGRLEKMPFPGVELRTLHQLEPDLAEDLSAVDWAIFVDAATPESPAPLVRTDVQPRFQGHAVAHYLAPSDLLALSQTLYGRHPRAVLFTRRGHNFNFGEKFSVETAEAVNEAATQIAKLIHDLTSK